MTTPHATAPPLSQFIDEADLRALIERARREDMGPDGVDVTAELLVPADQAAEAAMRARKPGRLCGAAMLTTIAEAYGRDLRIDARLDDGAAVEAGDVIAVITGPLRAILAMERIALNFVTHLSGVATLTAACADAVAHTKARIYDTRKTIPGLRALAKYAVACGGGCNHRMGLYDAVLVKDNHIAHLPASELARTIKAMVERANASRSSAPGETRRSEKRLFIEVEADRLDQLKQVLSCGVDAVLLDNMTDEQLRDAVRLRDQIAPHVELEASGGIDLSRVKAVAETGVDRIAIGALTHSAPALDIGLDIT